MTKASISCPKRKSKSLTGRTSTSDPGKKALMTPISTVIPPFTEPVTIPLTTSLEFIAASSSCHILMRLAFSRDRRVWPRPSSIESRATSTTSPSVISSSPLASLNSFNEIKPSDFKPTLIIAFSRFMLTTVPIKRAPGFTFCCISLFSNSSENDSDILSRC